MSKLYLVIASDIDGACVDDDCIFKDRDIAEMKCKELIEEFPSQVFNVVAVDVPGDGTEEMAEAVEHIAESIEHHAEAMSDIAKALNEFMLCSCTVDAMGEGHGVIHPTINVNHINRED